MLGKEGRVIISSHDDNNRWVGILVVATGGSVVGLLFGFGVGVGMRGGMQVGAREDE